MAPSQLGGDWEPGSYSPLQPCPMSSHKVGPHMFSYLHRLILPGSYPWPITYGIRLHDQDPKCLALPHCCMLSRSNSVLSKLCVNNMLLNVCVCWKIWWHCHLLNSLDRSHYVGGELYPLYLRQGQLVGSLNTENFFRPRTDTGVYGPGREVSVTLVLHKCPSNQTSDRVAAATTHSNPAKCSPLNCNHFSPNPQPLTLPHPV